MIGALDTQSGLVQVGADASLAQVEALAQTHRLTLGSLAPGGLDMTVAAYLEGAPRGLKAIRGGRLEPISFDLELATSEGVRAQTPKSPRSAAGPDLMALVLGGQGVRARVVSATLRLEEARDTRRTLALEFPDADSAQAWLFDALSAGAQLSLVRRQVFPDSVALEVECVGNSASVERESKWLTHHALGQGGRAGVRTLQAVSGPWAQTSWDGLERAFAQGASVELARLALSSVWYRGGAL